MSQLAIEKTLATSLSDRCKDLLAVIPENASTAAVHYNSMPEYTDGNGVHYLIADGNFTLDDAAYFAVMFNNASAPEISDVARVGLDSLGPLMPADIPMNEDDDPFQQVLAANNAPAGLRMFAWGLPGDFAPYNPE